MARSWEAELREKFPATRTWTYLNTASAGPVSYDTARAGCDVYQSLLSGGDDGWQSMVERVEQAREKLARLAGASAEELAFTRNTSHSASLVAQMLWEGGHRKAVALADEFPSSTLPFLNRGFDLVFVEPDEEGQYVYDDIDHALDGRTVLISSHVMYRTGTVLDPRVLGDIAQAHQAHFVFCCTQSLGALRVDFKATQASFLLGTSHKWLCAGYGAGFLGMRRDLIGQFRCPVAGWISQQERSRMRNDLVDFQPDARALEMGSATFSAVHALGAAVSQWLETGPEKIELRVRSLTQLLRIRLRDAGFALRLPPAEELSGITVVPFPHAEDASAALTNAHVAQTPRGAGIRFSVHAFNNETDIERAVEGMMELRAKLPA